jgi:hypothetical protein
VKLRDYSQMIHDWPFPGTWEYAEAEERTWEEYTIVEVGDFDDGLLGVNLGLRVHGKGYRLYVAVTLVEGDADLCDEWYIADASEMPQRLAGALGWASGVLTVAVMARMVLRGRQ